MFNSFKKVCLCTIINLSLILFIIILSFYLLRRLNRINLNNQNNNTAESFIVKDILKPTCPRVDLNKTLSNLSKNVSEPLNKVSNPLNRIASALERIDAKLDYVSGFKSIKVDKEHNKNREVARFKYPFGLGEPIDDDDDDNEEEQEEDDE